MSPWLLYIFSLGCSAIVLQTVIFREFFAVLHGSELVMSLVLSLWLFNTSFGAWVYARFMKRAQPRTVMAACAAGIAVLAPLTIAAVRASLYVIGTGGTEVLPVLRALPYMAAVVFPVELCGAAGFVAGYTMLRQRRGSVGGGLVYGIDCLGSFIGGLVFSFIGCRYLGTVRAALFASALPVLSLVFIYRPAGQGRKTGGLYVLAAVYCLCLAYGGPVLDRATRHMRFQSLKQPGRIVFDVDTRYQNVMITEDEGLYSIYRNCFFDCSFPDPESRAFDAALSLAMARPKQVLLIGLRGLDLAAHYVSLGIQVDCVELDSALTDMVMAVDPRGEGLLSSGKLTLLRGDGRLYVKKTRKRYDLVCIDMNAPATLYENRYFTKEFYRETRDILVPDGIVLHVFPGEDAYTSEEYGRFLYSLTQALGAVFDRQALLSAYHVILAAGNTAGVTGDARVLAQRYTAGGWVLEGFRPELFSFIISPGRAADMLAAMAQQESGGIEPNSDIQPATYAYMTAWHSAVTNSRTGTVITRLGTGRGPVFFVILFLLSGCVLRLILRPAGRDALYAMGTTGFVSIGMELALITLYQSAFGYIFERLALLVGIVMLGMAAGALSWRGTMKPASVVKLGEAGLFVLCGATAAFLWSQGLPDKEVSFYGLLFTGAFLCGLEFPACVELYGKSGTGNPGRTVYCVDNLGAAVGALITAVVVIPFLGCAWAFCLFAFLKALSIVLPRRA